jgi:Mu-like prophage I protein
VQSLFSNAAGFKMPADGWYQLAPLGEFVHMEACVIQVVDAEACVAMASRFKGDSAVENFAGLLVDFDHGSLDGERRSEAAGWIGDVAARPDGLWAQIRWSDVGELAVKGGRYRFLSPVWARSDCVDLGYGRVRPVRLLNAAVTNDPNLKGMCPLANRSQESVVSSQNGEAGRARTATEFEQKSAKEAKGGGGPVDSCASVERDEGGGMSSKGGSACGGKPEFRNGEKVMKRVMEKLVNHLGLPGDATEDVILEKMQGLPGLTAVSDLQNSLKQAQDERDGLKADLQNSVKQSQADRDALQGKLKGAEDELVNRHLAEFEGVISEATKPFWAEQLLKNRDGALLALGDVAKKRDEGPVSTDKSAQRDECPAGTRKPLHNRATARPVIPGQGGASPSTGSGSSEGRAVKIRNRAHEIAKGDGVAFSTAFRRAEKEVIDQ